MGFRKEKCWKKKPVKGIRSLKSARSMCECIHNAKCDMYEKYLGGCLYRRKTVSAIC